MELRRDQCEMFFVKAEHACFQALLRSQPAQLAKTPRAAQTVGVGGAEGQAVEDVESSPEHTACEAQPKKMPSMADTPGRRLMAARESASRSRSLDAAGVPKGRSRVKERERDASTDGTAPCWGGYASGRAWVGLDRLPAHEWQCLRARGVRGARAVEVRCGGLFHHGRGEGQATGGANLGAWRLRRGRGGHRRSPRASPPCAAQRAPGALRGPATQAAMSWCCQVSCCWLAGSCMGRSLQDAQVRQWPEARRRQVVMIPLERPLESRRGTACCHCHCPRDMLSTPPRGGLCGTSSA